MGAFGAVDAVDAAGCPHRPRDHAETHHTKAKICLSDLEAAFRERCAHLLEVLTLHVEAVEDVKVENEREDEQWHPRVQ